MARRPEHSAPPEIFYNSDEAKKYSTNTRIIEIQIEMAERAYELLTLDEDEQCFILDIGCGSGLSGSVLDDNDHIWVGVDISKAMLDIACEREVAGDLLLADMGEGMPFRPGTFDGAISISALQWLCNADKSSHNPHKRLYKFFSTLFSCLTRTARAVFQFYPENADQIEMVTSQAMKAGFYGGLVVDYPNSTKAKKYFLVLMTGGTGPMPKALGTEEEEKRISYIKKRDMCREARGKPMKKSREWILAKKERRRRQGRDTRPDTKYTGRKRSGKF
ncbi:probable 18S rRNA (guanine-N(7))-methyltransferase [Rhagoletis pomonella]|uniref:probable 18S rRNA (guanine-N(7))-methyltransferase n=1 Tax=Rhagoletis pomonella TaxID=28610 RepID=UPI001782EBA6|nr:probable 18S rRNA (guanine-N(7))-methyltransferase [Rhagoletis pomonella]XP_036322084.1 probable 18S rRNA (guanine-N(7))-methyltransferase [Rhagoletis pomonella]XP_036322089.1 probable 18S rRNA (guanine-N(7))-methyltransferase [Rhagoletis pomonella]